MTTPPTSLDYSSSGNRARPPLNWGSFFLGILAGLLFSGGYYFAIMEMGFLNRWIWSALGAVVIKVVVGMLLARTSHRSIGVGVLTSIPLAVLIFVGVCFPALSHI